MAALRKKVPETAARAAGARVARHLLELPELSAARRVAFYAALADELPTGDLLAALQAREVTMLLPRCVPTGGMEFAVVERFEDLVPGRYGVREPEGAAVPLGAVDVVVAPGVAFDPEGRRLGRGGGYYDRTFPAGVASPFLIGVGYGFQRIHEVPAESRDRRMNAIVTDAESLRVKEKHGG